jgi:hypothetical protein
MAAVPLPDGRTLLATGDYGGAVRLWNPDGAVEAIRLVTGTAITAITAITTVAHSGLAIAGDVGLAYVTIDKNL